VVKVHHNKEKKQEKSTSSPVRQIILQRWQHNAQHDRIIIVHLTTGYTIKPTNIHKTHKKQQQEQEEEE
jgi:predicted RNase H-like nuclease